VIVAGGYTGHGVALGVKAGAMIADAIVDGKPLPSWASPAR
jgi:glycine/D-amino acid oxidase-like deaminating enzyme